MYLQYGLMAKRHMTQLAIAKNTSTLRMTKTNKTRGAKWVTQ